MAKVFFIFALAFISCTFAYADVSDVGIERNVAKTWCIANPLAGEVRLQKDIDALCKVVDCTPISPGGSCYNPNTVANHASFVFDCYYRAHQSQPSACYFGGDALLVVNNPSSGSCIFP